ncbi:crotonase/enoyl-CoA hydratase family protein [Paralcaligenes sp. KSB-10]|jgi:enoyl-CoA hydratase/carnithine racemase|uniref:crotonase/enoyl-CoA hydratase family protein n=1 Tax=Paralcaligenes sp. KSB-10 TaxID=2901142 RepID=UPI001E432CE5|nr:crotonase/enoyl-CoA hydratase family protein [Paralcaligenes sp. KSB-10]UHL62742.1 crotonase/enoyl-CoA hydratase family protein [Paralcaligenes sp. KSB-10]
MDPILHFEQDERGIVTLTMDHNETRNALTGNNMVKEFLAAIQRIETDHAVRAVIITGAGKVFSSGGNIAEMERQLKPEFPSPALRHEYREGIQRLPLALHNLEVPTIAAINGPAIGAGFDLACMCDIRIASDRAVFAESFVKLGIIPGDGGAWFLPRLIGMSRAAEMTLTGDPIDVAQAVQWGLVSKAVPAEELLAECRKMALRIVANPSDAIRMSKRLLREGQHSRLDTLLELSAAFQAMAHKSEDHATAVRAFMQKRAQKK